MQKPVTDFAPCEGEILSGSLFSEPMRVETVRSNGPETWVLGLVGVSSERFRSVTLTAAELATLKVSTQGFTYAGDAHLLRLGLQAYALGIAYEYDPYFGLSISRVDPLPHQLEAVYDYLLKLARVRFLLADDAGAGKTIMAGLLIKELRLRGLAERILIVCPANLTFQWQRELNEKFGETFLVLKGATLRDQFGINHWQQNPRVITSLDLAKRADIVAGLRQVKWDLAIVDEAHRMSATPNRKTERYVLGEEHIDMSLTELIRREDDKIGRFFDEAERGVEGAAGLLKMAEDRHSALFARRQRRAEELARQRSLSLQGVERIASVLVLPHPDRDQPQMQNLHPDPETEAIAMRAVMEYEWAQGRHVDDVHEKNLGYDITSLDTSSGELRLIEIKGLAGETGTVALTPNEKRVAEDRRDCYWLYVVTRCKRPDGPQVMFISDPARLSWHEVRKVEHYQLSVDALKSQPGGGTGA